MTAPNTVPTRNRPVTTPTASPAFQDQAAVDRDRIGAALDLLCADIQSAVRGFQMATHGWYVLDVTQVQAIRAARDELIRPELGDRPNPASTLVQAAALVRLEFLVEVEAVAALPD